MKPIKFIIYLLSIIVISSLPAGAVKTINANPINVAVVIVETNDSVKIAETLYYYGYGLKETTYDGYIVMKHPNGNEIRYSLTDQNDSSNHTKVVVKTKATHKEIDKLLTDLKFKKGGNLYERMINRYNNQITQCNFGPNKTLVFQRFTNKKSK